jgi:hypothetical protein
MHHIVPDPRQDSSTRIEKDCTLSASNDMDIAMLIMLKNTYTENLLHP